MLSSTRRGLALLLMLLLDLSPSWRAQAADGLTPERQAVILARALAYDRGLKERHNDAVWVGVLGKNGDEESRATADAVLVGFRGLEAFRVQGMPLRALRMVYVSPEDLGARLARQRIAVLFVAPSLDAEIAAIMRVCRQLHVLSIGGRPAYVRAGLSLGAFWLNSRNTIMINLPASRAEGADFDAELLRLAEVIR